MSEFTKRMTDLVKVKDQLAMAIVNRVDVDRKDKGFSIAMQDAIAAGLAGLKDELQADLYARIIDGSKLVQAGEARLYDLVRYELERTNLWDLR